MLPYMVFSTAMDFMQHIAWAQSTVPMMHIHNKFLIHLFLSCMIAIVTLPLSICACKVPLFLYIYVLKFFWHS